MLVLRLEAALQSAPEVSNFVAQLLEIGRFVPDNLHRLIELPKPSVAFSEP
jgi:hypothetical protein